MILHYSHLTQGPADPVFSLGGGGGAQEIMSANAHYERKTRSAFRQGSRARLRALEAPWLFYALSCYLSLISKHSDTKFDKKTQSIKFKFRGGGGGACCAPSGSAIVTCIAEDRLESIDINFEVVFIIIDCLKCTLTFYSSRMNFKKTRYNDLLLYLTFYF